ncbi:18056_t:CDS:1 [Acaulospora morrowiae]|uniref:18056_t:CDS:1 n=1 Tax=Acaulospora morrowiae TaxID=94023 RepID=A0A9N8ZHE5_9GLOM|nr:18056_t:CDS:1 [Acaulospora morrowiae]
MHFLQLPECLEGVFKHLDNKSLYQCLFVNRFWSQNVVPFFWFNPFLNYSHFTEASYIDIIETYISCLPKKTRGQLFVNLEPVVLTTPSFNYPSYLRHLEFTIIYKLIMRWTTRRFKFNNKTNYDLENQIFREIWNMLLSSCPSFKSLVLISLDYGGFNEILHDPHVLFTSTNCTRGLFEKLDLFHSYCMPSEIINCFAQISTQTTKMRITNSDMNPGMDALIRSQKNLKTVALINCSNLSKVLQILHENHSSNLIELTIKEKEFDPTWNEVGPVISLENLQILTLNSSAIVFSKQVLEKFLFTTYKNLTVLDVEIHSPHISQLVTLLQNTNNKLVYLRLLWYYHKDPENIMLLTKTVIQCCINLTLLTFKLSKETIHLLPTILGSLILLTEASFYNASSDASHIYNLEELLPECGKVLHWPLKYLGLLLPWTITAEALEIFFKNAEANMIKEFYLYTDSLDSGNVSKEHQDILDMYASKGVGAYIAARANVKPENEHAYDIKM